MSLADELNEIAIKAPSDLRHLDVKGYVQEMVKRIGARAKAKAHQREFKLVVTNIPQHPIDPKYQALLAWLADPELGGFRLEWTQGPPDNHPLGSGPSTVLVLHWENC